MLFRSLALVFSILLYEVCIAKPSSKFFNSERALDTKPRAFKLGGRMAWENGVVLGYPFY